MSFRNLDLNLLRVFDVVMDERNLTRAAQRLTMTQPAVSNALRRLREATGQELFARAAKGVTPTTEAEALWPAVRDALTGLRQAFDPQAFDPATDAHGFRAAMADATAALLMPALVAALQAQAPQVQLRVIPLTTRDPRHLLEQGQADLAMGFFPAVAAAVSAEGHSAPVRLAPLYESDYVCVMRRGHPLAEPGALTLDSYCAARHMLVSFSGRPHGFVDEALAALGRQRRIVVTVNQFATAGRVATASDILTVLPRHFLPATGLQDALAACELPFEVRPIQVGLLWHRRHEHDPAQRWLREVVLASVRGPESLSEVQ
jgi:DNA-binding transcriptional LysR family regulator